MSRGAQELDGWIFDYEEASRALEIIGGQPHRKHAQVGSCLDRLLARLADVEVEYVAATVLADKVPMIRALAEWGLEVVAYLPAWTCGSRPESRVPRACVAFAIRTLT
jgi:hypothetical protein